MSLTPERIADINAAAILCRSKRISLDPATVKELCAMANRASVLETVVALHANFGYEADIDISGTTIGWCCLGPKCGQPIEKPHLDGCPVGALAAAPEPGEPR